MPTRPLLRRHTPVTQSLQQVLCALSVLALLYILTVNRTGGFDSHYRILLILSVCVGTISYRAFGVFNRYAKGHQVLVRMLEAWAVCLAIIIFVGFFTKTSQLYSRQVLLLWAVTGAVAQAIIIIGTRFCARLWHNGMQNHLRSAVIGDGWLAEHLTTCINRNAFLPDKVVGLISGNGTDATGSGSVPVLGQIDNIEYMVREFKLDRLYVALPIEKAEEVSRLQADLKTRHVDLLWVPDIYSFNLVNPSVREIGGVPIISLSETPLAAGTEPFVKNLMDRLLATFLIVLLGPLMLAIAVMIRLDSPGPALYRQTRNGWDDREFTILKFRTMKMHEETPGTVTQATRDDSRVTRVGRWLRRTSLDELPQLFNVLSGVMSLVGPRPHAVAHNQEYAEKIRSYMARHRIKPGLTGWAQVQGYRGETDTLDKMSARVNLDLEYINNWSLSMDLWILLRTPLALIRTKDAF